MKIIKKSIFYRPYSEECARRYVMHCFPELDWKLIHSAEDPPDLVDEEKGIGLEVTSANKKEDAELDSNFDKYVEYEKKDIPKGVLKKAEISEGRFIFSTEGGKEILRGVLHFGRELGEADVVNAVKKKTARLNCNDYRQYELDALYIQDEEGFIFEKRIPEYIIKQIKNETSRFSRHFEVIFIHCVRDIYMLNMTNESIEKRTISDQEIERIRHNSIYALGRGLAYERIVENLTKHE